MSRLFKALKRQSARYIGVTFLASAAILHTPAVLAGQTLYGVVSTSTFGPSEFGSIDPATGTFTRIGGATLPAGGYYAPVYDPNWNAFYVTSVPFSNNTRSEFFSEINASTGALTQHQLGFFQFPVGLGVNPNTGQLYGIVSTSTFGPSEFGSIDPATGAFTRIGSATLPAGGYYDPVYDPTRDVFYVTSVPFSNTTRSEFFAEINASTGALTQHQLGFFQFPVGLGLNPTTGQLYGVVSTSTFGPSEFGSINPATGTFTRIGSATLPAGGYYDPVYDPTRDAFYVTSVPFSDNTRSEFFSEINASTGALTQHQLGFFQFPVGLGLADTALTSVPEPASALQLLAYVCGIAVVASMKRRMSGGGCATFQP